MPADNQFSEYAMSYSPESKSERNKLPPELRSILDIIVDMLTENPNKYPDRNTKSAEADDIFVYKHPNPNLQVTYKLNIDKKRIDILNIAAINLELRKPLFISYCHEDKKWLDELRKWLMPLEQLDLIKIWCDQEIKPGTEWQKEIERALSDAKVALLLITQDFLVSSFINNKELPQILQRAKAGGLNILWIAVKESTVEVSAIEQFQAVHKEPPLKRLGSNAREKAYKQIFYKIKEAVGQ